MKYYFIAPALLAGVVWWYCMERYLCKRTENLAVMESEKELPQKTDSTVELNSRKSIRDLAVLLLLTGAGSILFQLYGFGIWKSIRYMVLMMSVYLISIIDHREMIVPNHLLLPMLGFRGAILIPECVDCIDSGYVLEVFLAPFLGLLFGGGLFFLCYLITRKGIGAGDVKLFAVIGAYTGPGILFPIMLISAFFSAVYGVIMLAFHKLGLKDAMPFAPFAAAGTIVALLIGF